jgi:DNA repair protein RadD
MTGRASRIAPGKKDALILDFAGNAMRHGPVDQIEAWTPRPSERGGDAPAKSCPECETICATAVRQCPTCGYVFPFDANPKHEAHASDAPILSTDLAPRLERHAVAAVDYQYWPGRDGKLPTLKVTYRGSLMRIASEWICFEHQGYPRTKAASWWATRAITPIPSTVDEAEQRAPGELRQPVAVVVNTRPKYPEIVGYEWEARAQVA